MIGICKKIKDNTAPIIKQANIAKIQIYVNTKTKQCICYMFLTGWQYLLKHYDLITDKYPLCHFDEKDLDIFVKGFSKEFHEVEVIYNDDKYL